MDNEFGVLERLELVGQAYEVQTEVVDQRAWKVRTSIFHQGRVVAVREARLHGAAHAEHSPEVVRELLQLHHQNVVHGFAKRTKEYLARGAMEVATPQPVQATPVQPTPELAVSLQLPPLPEDPALADALDVRRLFGELRLRIERRVKDAPSADTGGSRRDVGGRLDRSVAAFEWATTQPQFQRVRIDEQVRFNHLIDRIHAWDQHGRNPEEGEWIWTDVVMFCGYIGEINQRADLTDFDRQLVAWGLAALQRRGPSASTLKPVHWLFGRDRVLDIALEDPAEDAPWTALLERVQESLGA